MQFSELTVVEFLSYLYEHNHGYSSINTARSALSVLFCDENGFSIGKDPLVKRFVKGVFESKPPLPRYVSTWNVNIVISYLKLSYPLSQFSLDHVTCKLTMLLMPKGSDS